MIRPQGIELPTRLSWSGCKASIPRPPISFADIWHVKELLGHERLETLDP